MKTSWWMRFTFLILAVLVSVSMLIPTAMNFGESSSYPLKSKINLGLDLQGGLYMILGIDFNKAYKDEIQGYTRKIEYVLKDQGMSGTGGEVDASDVTDPKQWIELDPSTDKEKAKEEIKKFFPGILRLTSENGQKLQYALNNVIKTQIQEQSVGKSIEVIRNRIDEFGVTEPEIVSQGSDRIIVQLPGVKDIQRARDLIGKTAKLEFRMVDDQTPFATIQGWLEKATQAGIVYKEGNRWSEYLATLNDFLKKDLPANRTLAFERKISKTTNKAESAIPYLVEANPRMTGDLLQDARVQIDQQKNEPYVSLEFKSQGAKIFEEVTGENIGKRMAIMLDGNVYSAPNIQTKIAGGRAQITLGGGNFNNTMKEARDLALVLRAGALPVQLDFQEERTVGPSLGQDSIKKAELAGSIGAVLVFVFIIFYYKVSGFIASITLFLNVIFTLAFLVAFEATLTLPGIAGIALTIGMAVDANIIIYERIREEIKKGIGYYKAVENGFAHAFWTILDANITTALAGLCLLNFGTGPIRGFAVTLLIGIASTVYTSYFVSKIVFELYMNKVEGQDLSI
ncbi:MAG: protein translocase subunit SecD [Bdellovibrio sp. CG12_big_fil_rev_8_21_14_0_65_39_13]|nr:MAG: protein translocase subunit SecD [Bdellovibrio sp. CG22_combo_CG10-13_8_21_14_all_39_27]PIQ58593.1 MAG: protein translocase subunit SecD [Bdellovibrio sp. CG12_big_fil_rev_8_21_14_0_65_39_13]PIR33801.1 MAG: protein translocase subunit SecD [Bdellovibrio sp. CG11_big_fil_rev_8_21_14_0_20_39_38]